MNQLFSGRHKGFTILELIVTIAIMAILATIAIPSFSNTIRLYRLRTATFNLKSHMEMAKTSAIKENNRVVIAFDVAANSYSVFVDSGAAAGRILVQTPLHPSLSIVNADFDGNPVVRFNGRGLPNSAGEISLVNSDNSRYMRVTLSNVGRTRISRSSDNINWEEL